MLIYDFNMEQLSMKEWNKSQMCIHAFLKAFSTMKDEKISNITYLSSPFEHFSSLDVK